jgi:hypothetical protein
MGIRSWVRVGFALLASAALAASSGCDHHCGLGEHGRVTVTNDALGPAPCCGIGTHRDVALSARTSDPEFSLSNVDFPTEAGGVDAFLVPTTCEKLFDGPYPGAAPLCTVYAGPAKPGGVSSRAKLSPGTYRVYLQSYSNVTSSVRFLVDVYTWDYSCGGIVQ